MPISPGAEKRRRKTAGSRQSGFAHPELFHYVLAYSGGFGGIGPATQGDIKTKSPWMELLANSEQTKKNLRLLFLGAGQQETPMLPPGKRLVKVFKEKGINAVWADYPGGHVFSVWRNHLDCTAPMLFRSESLSREAHRSTTIHSVRSLLLIVTPGLPATGWRSQRTTNIVIGIGLGYPNPDTSQTPAVAHASRFQEVVWHRS